MAVLGLCFSARASSSCGKRGPLFIAACAPRLSLSQPLLLRGTGSRRTGSVIVAHGSSCSAACGIFPDQGSNPCPLHWQADSQPLRHQGCPHSIFNIYFLIYTGDLLQPRSCLLIPPSQCYSVIKWHHPSSPPTKRSYRLDTEEVVK